MARADCRIHLSIGGVDFISSDPYTAESAKGLAFEIRDHITTSCQVDVLEEHCIAETTGVLSGESPKVKP